MNRQKLGTADSDKPGSNSREPTRGGPKTSQTVGAEDAGGEFSPLRFLITTIGGIALAEVIAMGVLYYFRDWPYHLQTVFDASVMIVLIYPLIYFTSLKPLLHHIDERKRKEHALRRSEERFALAYRSNPAALSILRVRDACIIDVNDSFLKLYGYSREEVVGHVSDELSLYPNAQERDELRWSLIKEGRVDNYEMATRIKSIALRQALGT